jgi:hypothetical protein
MRMADHRVTDIPITSHLAESWHGRPVSPIGVLPQEDGIAMLSRT